MEMITSSNNKIVKLAKQLKQKKARDQLGKFLVEGVHLVAEVVKWTSQLETVLVAESFLEAREKAGHRLLLEQIAAKKIPVLVLADRLFAQLVDTERPQGVLGLVRHRPAETGWPVAGDFTYGLVLDRIQDPGNLGTLIRTADAAGFDRVFLTKGTVDPYNGKVLRAAMGSHFHLQLSYLEDQESFLRQLKKSRVTLAVAHLQDAQPIFESRVLPPVVLVLGNEAHGPDRIWLQAADLVVKIPLLGKAESLNVAVAGAVLMYELIRQNKFDHQ